MINLLSVFKKIYFIALDKLTYQKVKNNIKFKHLHNIFRGRVKHGRHFTFKSILDDTAITLVAESVTGTQVSFNKPYALLGNWLQVCLIFVN